MTPSRKRRFLLPLANVIFSSIKTSVLTKTSEELGDPFALPSDPYLTAAIASIDYVALVEIYRAHRFGMLWYFFLCWLPTLGGK